MEAMGNPAEKGRAIWLSGGIPVLLRSDVGRLRRVPDIVTGTSLDILWVRLPKLSDVEDFCLEANHIQPIGHGLVFSLEVTTSSARSAMSCSHFSIPSMRFWMRVIICFARLFLPSVDRV